MLPPRDTDHLHLGQREGANLLRLKSEIAAIRMDRAFLRLWDLENFERRYSDNQPRGQDGRWVNAVGRALLAVARRNPVATVLAVYALYETLSGNNTDQQRAVAEFVSRDYEPGSPERLEPRQVAMLDREQVDAACRRLEEVELRTQDAMDRVRRERPELRGAALGTAVHHDLKLQIDAIDNPNFVAEQSYSKITRDDPSNARYGEKNSIRVDVFENAGNKTVCVYDIKTGDGRLDSIRSFTIAAAVMKRFPGTARIIITQVKPRQ